MRDIPAKILFPQIGTTTADHAYIDVSQAQALGVDAFVLNVGSATEAWAIEAVAALFIAAESLGFKLFFSFDMTWFTDPSQFMPMLLQYIENDAYYMHNGLRVVSTFSVNASVLTYPPNKHPLLTIHCRGAPCPLVKVHQPKAGTFITRRYWQLRDTRLTSFRHS